MTATKLVELLFLCGICPLPRAKVLAMFIECKGKEVTSRQVERKTDLRQPEVSLALSAFTERKWVTELKPKTAETKGRPTKLYILGVPQETIYQSIAKGIEKDFKEKTGLLEQLKTAMMVVKISVQPEIPSQGKQLNLIEK
jgi:predicted transcriptional regulator